MQQTPITDSSDSDIRLRNGREWALRCLGWPDSRVSIVAGDASFRRYFRLCRDDQTRVLMDADPQHEDCRPFVDVAKRLQGAGLHAPAIHHVNLEHGYLVLEDLGDKLYRDLIDEQSATDLFIGIFDALITMATKVPAKGLPPYGPVLLQQELDLFTDWYLDIHRKTGLTAPEEQCWRNLCGLLIKNAADQPQVFVHRDFHSCNLLQLTTGEPAIIDFQDAVRGPLSYDFASLLWDRYIAWPQTRIRAWMEQFYDLMEQDFADTEFSREQWVRWCELTGLQRNLKIVGIFARLHYRDGRAGYLEMIPRFYDYVLEVARRYPELSGMQTILEDKRCAP
jgi:aminoglycoside/choline kinase family phosphotransferase